MQNDYLSYSVSARTGMCLLSPTCVAIGAHIIASFETQGEGVSSSTMSRNPSDGDTLTLQKVFALLILDSIIYIVITW